METLLLVVLILIMLGIIPLGRRRRSFTAVQVVLLVLIVWLILRLF